MSAQSAADYADPVHADPPQPGPGDCELAERALAAYRRESLSADVRAITLGDVVLIVASTCSPQQAPDGRYYCMCTALAAYRLRGDGRLRRTGTCMYTGRARDQHKTPERRAAEEAHARALLRILRNGG